MIALCQYDRQAPQTEPAGCFMPADYFCVIYENKFGKSCVFN